MMSNTTNNTLKACETEIEEYNKQFDKFCETGCTYVNGMHVECLGKVDAPSCKFGEISCGYYPTQDGKWEVFIWSAGYPATRCSLTCPSELDCKIWLLNMANSLLVAGSIQNSHKQMVTPQ